MKIGFIGLGKLGLPIAEIMADGNRHTVVGYDIAKRTLVNVEPARSIEAAVAGAELIFIAVPTPHDPEYDGSKPVSGLPPKDFDYSAVESVLVELSKHVRAPQQIVLISTCLPGTCARLKKLIPDGVDFFYNPYFVAMGDTLQDDFLFPELIVIGRENVIVSPKRLIDFYRSIGIESYKRLVVATYTEAEAIKVFYNTFISMKLAFVNMIQDFAMTTTDVNADTIAIALTMADQRLMSPAYMCPGMGDGGPCHPRDNIALSSLMLKQNVGYDLFGTITAIREKQAWNLANYIANVAKYRGIDRVVMIGKTYKSGVPIIDGSYSCLVAHYLRENRLDVVFHDLLVGENAEPWGRAVYVLAHEYHDQDFPPGSVIVDPWRTCPTFDFCETLRYGDTSSV